MAVSSCCVFMVIETVQLNIGQVEYITLPTCGSTLSSFCSKALKPGSSNSLASAQHPLELMPPTWPHASVLTVSLLLLLPFPVCPAGLSLNVPCVFLFGSV